MLKYNFNDSNLNLYRNYLKNIDGNDNKDIDLEYMIISDPQFLTCIKNNCVESWKYLKKSMKIPPTLLIDSFISKTNKHIDLIQPTYQRRKKNKIHCYFCPEKLCDNMEDKIKFLEIKCSCNKIYTHIKCGNDFILKNAQCDVCKEYYDVNQYCSSLRSILTM